MHTFRRNDVKDEARDWLYFVVASGAQLEAFQRGRSSDLGVGQMALISNREPAWIRQTKGSRWSVRIPQKLLKDLCRNFEDKVARPITASKELTRLLLHQMETANRFGPKLGAAENHVMAQHILDLVGLCLGADRDAAHVAEHRGLSAARFDAIKSEILHRIGAGNLSLADIASHDGSTRYVQHLFDEAATRFTGFLLEHRLRMPDRLLRDPSHRRRKVSDIAAAAGFPDISYFNRAFKVRFAATPREIRIAAFAAGPDGEPLPEFDDQDSPLSPSLAIVP